MVTFSIGADGTAKPVHYVCTDLKTGSVTTGDQVFPGTAIAVQTTVDQYGTVAAGTGRSGDDLTLTTPTLVPSPAPTEDTPG